MSFDILLLGAVAAIYAVPALPYLITYRQLTKQGLQTEAYINSTERKNWLMPSIPIVSFATADTKQVTGKPVFSWFSGTYEYRPGTSCTIYYLQNNPAKFVIKNKAEVRSNILWLVFAVVVFVAAILSLW